MLNILVYSIVLQVMFTPFSRIDSYEFKVSSTDNIILNSAVNVTNSNTFKDDEPFDHGAYDASMGSTSIYWKCKKCRNRNGVCPGHPGSLDLNYPLKSPMFVDKIYKWLQCICLRCGLLANMTYQKHDEHTTFDDAIESAKKKKICPHCAEPKYRIVYDLFNKAKFMIETGEDKSNELYNHHIRDAFERVTDDTVRRLREHTHPSDYILSTICVPPNTIRPDIKHIGGGSATNSELTAVVKDLVKYNAQIPAILPANNIIELKALDAMSRMEEMYISSVKKSPIALQSKKKTRQQIITIMKRISDKTGRIKRNLLGKKARYTARAVISGDNTLRIDELGVPEQIARALPIEETVRSFNIARLSVYFHNGRHSYPGCHGIKSSAGGMRRIETLLEQGYVLKVGDIILRDLIDGDFVDFNRQPSINFGQIGGHRVKVLRGRYTLAISPSACKPYAADFDGDSVTMYVGQTAQTRVEMETLSWIGNWAISFANSLPYFGVIWDGLTSMADLTRAGTQLDKWHAMQICSGIIPFVQGSLNFSEDTYAGKDIVPKIIPPINIVNKKSTLYVPQYEKLVYYHPDDKYVNINRGVLESGLLDSSTIGELQNGSIFHITTNEYGREACLVTNSNIWKVSARFMTMNGLTLSPADIMISENARRRVKEVTEIMKRDAADLVERLNKGELIPPLGTTLVDYFESEYAAALDAGDKYIEIILSDIDIYKNNLAKMIFTGSKGGKSQFVSISSCIGLIKPMGRLVQRKAGWGRVSAYFPRYDLSPVSMGFIEQSYADGLRPESFYFSSLEARVAAITSSVITSQPGALTRIMIKNTELIVINNLCQSSKPSRIVQFLYADNAYDTRKVEPIKFLTLSLNDAELAKRFHSKDKKHQALLDREYKRIKEDRDFVRACLIQQETFYAGVYMFNDVVPGGPCNVERIINNTIFSFKDQVDDLNDESLKTLNVKYVVEEVELLCNKVQYIYFDDRCFEAKMVIPEHISVAVRYTQAMIRMYLSVAYLTSKEVNTFYFMTIIEKVYATIYNAVAQPGCAIGVLATQTCTYELTQYSLDSRHRTGGVASSNIDLFTMMRILMSGKARDVNKYTPSMLIFLREDIETNKIKVQSLASEIEMIPLTKLVKNMNLFFESYGEPEHPEFKEEAKMISSFERANSGLKVSKTLTKWCIRYELSREAMLETGIKLEDIVIALKIKYPHMFVVYTPESSEHIVLRCYISYHMIKTKAGKSYMDMIIDLVDAISGSTIRGIPNIKHADVLNFNMSYVDEDGAIQTKEIYAITTLGSNLEEVLYLDEVDPTRTQTDDLIEFQSMYGINATRSKLYYEFRKSLDKSLYSNMSIMIDEMCSLGHLTGLQKTGLKQREYADALLRGGFQTATKVFETAAINNTKCKVAGITAPLCLGQIPAVGSTYNQLVMDTDLLKSDTMDDIMELFK
jgi:DNA-directed RNA polymerase II subunit RPB1